MPDLHRALAAALVLAVPLAAVEAGAQATRGDVPLADILEVLLIDRDLVAVDAEGGGQVTLRLELGENVLWRESRGRIGVVLTDRRVLAVATGSAAWQETRYRRSESVPEGALLGDRVAVLTTAVRAIGFNGETGNLLETGLGPREKVLRNRVGENVAVVLTDRRALGLSPFVGGFFPVRLDVGEDVEALETRSNVATLTTQRRVLIFRSPTGTWEERLR